MNKTSHMPWLRALCAAATLVSHTLAPAASKLPDCTLDEKGQSVCFQRFSEGLAAVLVPVVGQSDGRWGFIDTRGLMVVKPGYTQVRPFANGLAAAQRRYKWGFIDTSGRWVIEPLYDQATSFGADGHALVTRADELLRIDRSGQTQGIVPASQRAVLHDPVDIAEQRWSVSLELYGQLWDLQRGRVMPIPEKLSNVSTPQDGLIAAEMRLPSGTEYWGLLNLQGEWAMHPRLLRSTDRPLHDQGLVARRGPSGWQFVNLQGQAQHGDMLHEVELMRPGSWVVSPEDGKLELWDAQARRVMALPPNLRFHAPTPLGDSVVIKTQDDVALVAPQGRAWHWPLKGRRVHTAQNLLWLLRGEHDDPTSPSGTNEIIRPDGSPFLDAATRAQLDGYLVTPMNPDDARFSGAGSPIALALLEPLDSTRSPALITRDGRIVSQAEWLHIRARYDDDAPWVVQTRQGLFGAIDGQGRWRIAPVWQGLDDFNHGLALGRRADVAEGRRQVLLNSDGQLLNTPPAVSQDCTRWIGAVLACVDDQGPRLQHYLWHPLRQQRTDIAPIKQFTKLAHGLYRVQQGELWGLMDSQGAWRIQPRFANELDLRLLDEDVGLETVSDNGGPIRQRWRLISLADGHPLTALHLQEPEAMGVDRYHVHTEHEGSRVINARGETVLQQPWPSGSAQTEGDWASVLIDDIWGVMDLQGQWHVPARYRRLSGPFGPDQWLSVETRAGKTLLVNAEGQAMAGNPDELEAQPTPLPSPTSAEPALRLTQRGRQQAFVNAQGQAVITAQVQCQQLVLRNAQGQQTWPPQTLGCASAKQKGSHP